MNKQKYICPICGYDGLDESAYDEEFNLEPSFEICPNCNCEFGFDLERGGATTDGITIEEYRRKHLKAPWKKKYLKNLEGDEMQMYIAKINKRLNIK